MVIAILESANILDQDLNLAVRGKQKDLGMKFTSEPSMALRSLCSDTHPVVCRNHLYNLFLKCTRASLMHLKNYNLEILERKPDIRICVSFTSTGDLEMQLRSGVTPLCMVVKSLYNWLAFSPTFQLSLPLCIQDFNHISPFHISIFLVSPLPQLPFLFYWNPTPLLKWWLLHFMCIKQTNKQTAQHLKKSYSQFSSSQRFRFIGAGMGSKMGHYFISSPVSSETNVMALRKPLLKVSSAQPLPVPACSSNCSTSPTVLCSSH